jgi:lysophospholipase L1-like esterase
MIGRSSVKAARSQPRRSSDSAAAFPAGSPGEYHVVGLGDSVPAAGACGCASYVSLVGQQLARQSGRSSTLDNLAIGGMTTSGLITQLQQPAVRDTIAAADLVIITVGANDFDERVLSTPACQRAAVLSCYQETLTAQRTWLSSVLTQVNALIAQHAGTVLVTGYWNVFLDGQVGRDRGETYVEGSNALTLADNALIESASGTSGDTYVDIY